MVFFFIPVLFVEFHGSHFQSSRFIFAYHLRSVDFHLFDFEGASYDVEIMLYVVAQISVFLSSLQQSEDVVFLKVPDVAFVKCL